MPKTDYITCFSYSIARIPLIFLFGLLLVACGQEPAGTNDPSVSEEAADVAQESQQLVEEAGEELEQGVEQAGIAAAQTGEVIAEEAEQAGVLPQELTESEGVTLSQLDDNLDAYVNQTVSVRGDIIETVGSYAFQLSDPSLIGGDEILVVSPSSDRNAVHAGNTVEVSGVVHRFDLATIESETGLDLQDDLFVAWNNDDAVLIAQEIVNVSGASGS